MVAPGNLYCSLLPNFIVSGVSAAFRKARGKKVYVGNLMNKFGHTDGFSVSDYVGALETVLGKNAFDQVLYNNTMPDKALLKKYAEEGDPVRLAPQKKRNGTLYVGKNLLAKRLYRAPKGDKITRSLIRHDPVVLAQALYDIL